MAHALNPEMAPNVASAIAHGRRLLSDAPALAAQQAREILSSSPRNAEAYRLLGAALRLTGDEEGANEAELAAVAEAKRDPELMRAGAALAENDLPTAEAILRPVLKRRPTDVAAIRMMAELAARVGRRADSENLLRRAIELAPGWAAPRANLANLLNRMHRSAEALAELDKIQVPEGMDADGQRSLRAAVLIELGGYEEAIALYRQVLERHPHQPRIWMSLGHILKTVGELQDGIAAYRRALLIAPGLGEAWWSLANLKTVRFTDEDIAAMRSALEGDNLSEEDRLQLHFALGKALEERRDDSDAFANYAEGNRIRAGQMLYDPKLITEHVDQSISLFTRDFMDSRSQAGFDAPDPIFVIGMPRAGSTLIEQILASHSAIEGTSELHDIIVLSHRLAKDGRRYLKSLAKLSNAELSALGQEYLDRTRVMRRTDRPLFIDKMPANWSHLGIIRLILPRAKIIDARRHPLACGFSNFKQHYARGQGFSYSLETIGHHYSEYVRLMAHFDSVAPDAVHRVIHEELVANSEAEIRRLLDYLELPFEEACLRAHETKRAVRTPSSEQVRRPITSEGVDQWRRFEAWLGPLKEALGPVLDAYPEAPASFSQR
jgi:tetratricopeptide (TPR) repeat protein